MRITIPDALADRYASLATAQGRSLDEVVTAQLTRFSDLPPGERAVVADTATLALLDKRLGGGMITTSADLAAKVTRLAGIKFGNLQFDFSPQQLAELQWRAERQGRPVKDLVRDIFLSMQDQFFVVSGGGVAYVAPAAVTTPGKAKPGAAPVPVPAVAKSPVAGA